MHNIRHYFATPAAVLAALVFQVAAEAEARGTADIIWQHSSGQVHYWPMLGGERTDGINIFTPVGPDWTLRGVGDVDGDGTADIVWQHSSGQDLSQGVDLVANKPTVNRAFPANPCP